MRQSAVRRGFTLVEVLVALAILLTGIVAIVQLFPVSLRANTDAALKGSAVILAYQKVEEMRRDEYPLRSDSFTATVRNLEGETDPVAWPEDPRLTYSYSGLSAVLGDLPEDPGDPRTGRGVARVIVRLSESFDPQTPVIYELRFYGDPLAP
ncbi:MAG: prepilin-type N-terminal cleavage/methylation domain-containing protein [Sumerlaeia bacterium]